MKPFRALLTEIAILQAISVATAIGAHRNGALRLTARADGTDNEGTNGPNGWGTFDQLLDHSNPQLGTFK